MREVLATVDGQDHPRAQGARRRVRFAAAGEHSDEALRNVVTNFLLAGRDTASSALTWFFWHQARRRGSDRARDPRHARTRRPRRHRRVHDSDSSLTFMEDTDVFMDKASSSTLHTARTAMSTS
jgi:cytochrome P450